MPATQTMDMNELYSAWASGAVDPALGLLMSTQSALRADVARVLDEADMISGAILESENAAQMSTGVEAAFAAIDALDEDSLAPQRSAMLASKGLGEILNLPEPLRGVAIGAIGGEGWQKQGTGIQRLKLDIDGSEAELYRLEPGTTVPRHSHEGAEYTLCLTGEFSDETGVYGPGDISIKGDHDTHQPIAADKGVCYTLAVRDGGLKFTGLLGLIQKITGR